MSDMMIGSDGRILCGGTPQQRFNYLHGLFVSGKIEGFDWGNTIYINTSPKYYYPMNRV